MLTKRLKRSKALSLSLSHNPLNRQRQHLNFDKNISINYLSNTSEISTLNFFRKRQAVSHLFTKKLILAGSMNSVNSVLRGVNSIPQLKVIMVCLTAVIVHHQWSTVDKCKGTRMKRDPSFLSLVHFRGSIHQRLMQKPFELHTDQVSTFSKLFL